MTVGFDSTDRVTNGLSVAPAYSDEPFSSMARSSKGSLSRRRARIRNGWFRFCFACGTIAWTLFCAGTFICTAFQKVGSDAFGFWRLQEESGSCVAIPVPRPNDRMFAAGQIAALVGNCLGTVFMLLLCLILCRRMAANSIVCRCMGAAMIVLMSVTTVSCSLILQAEFCGGTCYYSRNGLLLYISALFWIISGVTLFSLHDFVDSAVVGSRSSCSSAEQTQSDSNSPFTSNSLGDTTGIDGEACGISMIESTGSQQAPVFGGTMDSRDVPYRPAPLAHSSAPPRRHSPETTTIAAEQSAKERSQRLHSLTQSILDEKSRPPKRSSPKIGNLKQDEQRLQTIVGVVGGNGEVEEGVAPPRSSENEVQIFSDEPRKIQPEVLPFLSMSAESTLDRNGTLEASTYSSTYESAPDSQQHQDQQCGMGIAGYSSTNGDDISVPTTIVFED